MFVLPTAYPVTTTDLNYAPVAVGIVLFGSIGWWLLPIIGARGYYKGAAGVCDVADDSAASGNKLLQMSPSPKEV